MRRAAFAVAALAISGLSLGGCGKDLGTEPRMSPVGAGLQASTLPFADTSYQPPTRTGNPSLFTGNRVELFRDPRAVTVGDVLTVLISINDKATLGNSTDRKTTSAVTNGFDLSFGTSSTPSTTTGKLDINSESGAKGVGNIDRSEKIQVSIAAVITNVLPNGNFVINGSQEIRVNYELRQVEVAGIVRPRDISKENTISYEKIAEARIAYGGRGRSSEIQQPGWGQQIYDAVKPF